MGYYIIQIVVFQFLFLAIYEVFLKKETFFQLNRAYLLVTPIISMALPLIKIERFKSMVPKEYIVALPEIVLGKPQQQAVPQTEWSAMQSLVFQGDLELVYSIGMVVALAIFLVKAFKVVRLLRYKVTYFKTIKLVKLPESNQAFSFFNYVFLGERISRSQIESVIRHELVHIRQKHTWDLLYFELLRIVFWFNPLISIQQNKISTLHEFIADAEVSKSQNKKDYYQSLLSQVFNTKSISFVNPFYKASLIKKRINMLQKPKSGSKSLFKYLVLIPMILGMLIYASCSDTSVVEISSEDTILEQIERLKQKAEEKGGLTKEERDNLLFFITQDVKDAKEIRLYNGDNSSAVAIMNKEEHGISETLGKVEVPFAIIDKAPGFPGCDSKVSEHERKECFTKNISEFVGKNFNVSLASALGLTGTQKIYVLFKVDVSGEIVQAKARAPHPELEEEALRVINMLPQLEPGEQDGKKVMVPYTLPIAFKTQ